MSRIRTRSLTSTPFVSDNLGKSSRAWLKTTPDLNGLVRDLVEKSYIVDELSPRGAVRPFNPCSHVRHVGSALSSKENFVDYAGSTPDRTWSFGAYVAYSHPSAAVPTDAWAGLINDLASKVNGFVKPQSLLAVTFWELRKTYAMVRNPFNLLRPDWRRYAGMHPARHLVKRASDLWLEGNYGWKACFLDMKGIAAGLAKVQTQNPHQALEGMLERWSVSTDGNLSLPSTIYPQGGSDSEWNTITSNRMGWQMYDMFRVNNYHAKWKVTVGCKQRVAAVNDLRLWMQHFQTFGLDRYSILSTLWEIVPFSFVVDWFIDTQSIWSPLSMARLAAPDISDLGCSALLEQAYTVEYFPVIDPWRYDSPWYYSTIQGCTGCGPIKGTTGYTRSYVRSLGLPSLSQILTIFKSKGLNSLQLTSGASLIVQQANNLFDAIKRVKTRRRR